MNRTVLIRGDLGIRAKWPLKGGLKNLVETMGESVVLFGQTDQEITGANHLNGHRFIKISIQF